MIFVPFRLKILGGFLTLFCVVVTIGFAIVRSTELAQTHANIRTRLGVTRDVFNSILERREKQLAQALQFLAADFAFKRALATQDPGTIASAALNFKERIGADAVWVADDRGSLYADTTGRVKAGRSISRWPVAAKALEGEPAATIQILGGVPYQLAAVPINAPSLVGILAAGFRIDNATAAELKRLTLSEVSFEAGGRIFATTLGPARKSFLEKCRGTVGLGPSVIGPSGGREIVLAVEPAPGVRAYLERSLEEALGPFRQLERLLVIVGLAGLALTVAFGFFLAEGITASMAKLAEATRRLVGGDYGVQVDIRQRDEVGQLGRAFNHMVTGLQEKEKIRSVLNKTVSKEIADELLRRGQINLGGEERAVTVLFTDIRDFTPQAEQLKPQQLVSQLNAYFTRMARVIEDNNGVIDKYIGDAIMALFGAPLKTPDDAAHAQRAALAMLAALEELNQNRIRQGLRPWSIGIGLNTGRAVAGTLGSENRWSYTVIGDAVNLASRLEGLTKHYGLRVLLSRETKEQARGGFLYRAVDLVRVKGKSECVEVFELLGEGPQPPSWVGPFEEGVQAYRRRDFAGAYSFFQRALELKPGDGLARVYLERLKPLLSHVPSDWDPAHTMSEK